MFVRKTGGQKFGSSPDVVEESGEERRKMLEDKKDGSKETL